MHGGKSPVGPALPQWKDGGRSKYLPKRLLDDYQASLDNPDKLLLDADIALIDSRLSDVLRRVDSGESMTTRSVLYALTAWNLEDPPGTPLPLTWGRLPLQLGHDIARGVLIDASEHVRGWRGYQGERERFNVRRVKVEPA